MAAHGGFFDVPKDTTIPLTVYGERNILNPIHRNTVAATDYMTKSPEIYRIELMRGLYTRVAKKLGLGPSGRSHVSRVAKGERSSPRVEAALRAETKRICNRVQKYESSLQSSQKVAA